MRWLLPARKTFRRTFPVVLAMSALLPGSPLRAHTSFRSHGGGYLGVNFENLTPQQRQKFGLPAKQGVAIAAVDHDAPAGKAGMRPNDVILTLNGKKAENAEELRAALHKMDPGERVTLDVLHEGRPWRMSIVLADRKTIEQLAWSERYTVPDPEDDPQDPRTGFLGSVPSEIGKTFSSNGGLMSYIPGTPPYTGILFDVMSPQLAHYFGLRNTTGLLIKSVDPDSPGQRAGLHAGDVICKTNDAPATSRGEWIRVLKENRHDAIKLQILRDHQSLVLLLTLAQSKS